MYYLCVMILSVCGEVGWGMPQTEGDFDDSYTTTTVKGERPWRRTTEKYKDQLLATIYYNPNNGYEAYWADGEWHIRNPMEWDFSNATTTRTPTVCGDECTFTSIGPVCARQASNTDFKKCSDNSDEDYCGQYENNWMPTHYITFDSYCKYLDAKCKEKDPSKAYALLYVGACKKDFNIVYKPMSNQKYPVSRLTYWLDELNKRITIKYLPSNYTTRTTTQRHRPYQG